MDSLLSPSESHALQSFLSALDVHDQSQDWALYSHTMSRSVDQDAIIIDIPHHQGKEALAKATKDLMALDSGFNDTNVVANSGHHHHQHLQHNAHQNNLYDIHTQYHQIDPFPFLNAKQQQQRPHYSQQSIPPLNTLALASANHSHFSYPPSMLPSPISPSHQSAQQTPASHHPGSTGSSVTPSRPVPRTDISGTSPTAAAAKPNTQSTKRPRLAPSPTNPTPTSQPHSQSSSVNPSQQKLLTPSQKKANHIQSEQKRRANIRRGYEALCDTVPALREAIREEEEAANLTAQQNGDTVRKPSRAKAKGKRGRKKNEDVDKDRIDGRAGPRSENVVLSKTIDYITDLLSERSVLLERLNRARSNLPQSHPALVPLCSCARTVNVTDVNKNAMSGIVNGNANGENKDIVNPDSSNGDVKIEVLPHPHGQGCETPLWEREWKGGEGKLGGDDDGDGDGDEGDGEEDGEGESINGVVGRGNQTMNGRDMEEVESGSE